MRQIEAISTFVWDDMDATITDHRYLKQFKKGEVYEVGNGKGQVPKEVAISLLKTGRHIKQVAGESFANKIKAKLGKPEINYDGLSKKQLQAMCDSKGIPYKKTYGTKTLLSLLK